MESNSFTNANDFTFDRLSEPTAIEQHQRAAVDPLPTGVMDLYIMGEQIQPREASTMPMTAAHQNQENNFHNMEDFWIRTG